MREERREEREARREKSAGRTFFFGRVLPSLKVGTAPFKNAGIRAGDPLRSTL